MSDVAPEAPPQNLCPCGHGADHEHIVEDPVYKPIDYMWMLLGVSSRPVPYARKCAICSHVFEHLEPRRPW